MTNLTDLFNNEFKGLEILGNYSIKFGILEGDEYRTLEVLIQNPDGTEITTDMIIKDLAYFVENGTITMPAYHLMDRILNQSSFIIDGSLMRCIDGIFDNNWSENEIEVELRNMCSQIQNYGKGVISSLLESNNTINNIINSDKNNNKYNANISKLKDYFKCELIKN